MLFYFEMLPHFCQSFKKKRCLFGRMIRIILVFYYLSMHSLLSIEFDDKQKCLIWTTKANLYILRTFPKKGFLDSCTSAGLYTDLKTWYNWNLFALILQGKTSVLLLLNQNNVLQKLIVFIASTRFGVLFQCY